LIDTNVQEPPLPDDVFVQSNSNACRRSVCSTMEWMNSK